MQVGYGEVTAAADVVPVAEPRAARTARAPPPTAPPAPSPWREHERRADSVSLATASELLHHEPGEVGGLARMPVRRELATPLQRHRLALEHGQVQRTLRGQDWECDS